MKLSAIHLSLNVNSFKSKYRIHHLLRLRLVYIWIGEMQPLQKTLLDLGAVVQHHEEHALVFRELLDSGATVEADGVLDENVVTTQSHKLLIVALTNLRGTRALRLHKRRGTKLLLNLRFYLEFFFICFD